MGFSSLIILASIFLLFTHFNRRRDVPEERRRIPGILPGPEDLLREGEYQSSRLHLILLHNPLSENVQGTFAD